MGPRAASQRVDLDAFPLDLIGDPSVADQVMALIAEVEALREAVGLAETGWRPDGLSPTQHRMLSVLLRTQGINRDGVRVAIWGHDASGGVDPRTLDVHLVRLRRWLAARGFHLAGGTYGAAFVFGDGDRAKLKRAFATRETPPRLDGRTDMSFVKPLSERVLRALQDGDQTAATLAACVGSSTFGLRRCLEAMEDGGFVMRQKRRAGSAGRPASVWSLTDPGRSRLARLEKDVAGAGKGMGSE